MTNAEENIRIAKFSDVTLLCRIHCAAFAKGWSEQQLFDSLKGNGCFAILAGDHAFVMFQIVDDECEIHTIAVEPTHQRKSLGKLLVEEMLGVCKMMAVNKVFLEVSEKNDAAINLYEKFRFINYNERKNYYADGSNALLLELKL